MATDELIPCVLSALWISWSTKHYCSLLKPECARSSCLRLFFGGDGDCKHTAACRTLERCFPKSKQLQEAIEELRTRQWEPWGGPTRASTALWIFVAAPRASRDSLPTRGAPRRGPTARTVRRFVRAERVAEVRTLCPRPELESALSPGRTLSPEPSMQINSHARSIAAFWIPVASSKTMTRRAEI